MESQSAGEAVGTTETIPFVGTAQLRWRGNGIYSLAWRHLSLDLFSSVQNNKSLLHFLMQFCTWKNEKNIL